MLLLDEWHLRLEVPDDLAEDLAALAQTVLTRAVADAAAALERQVSEELGRPVRISASR